MLKTTNRNHIISELNSHRFTKSSALQPLSMLTVFADCLHTKKIMLRPKVNQLQSLGKNYQKCKPHLIYGYCHNKLTPISLSFSTTSTFQVNYCVPVQLYTCTSSQFFIYKHKTILFRGTECLCVAITVNGNSRTEKAF